MGEVCRRLDVSPAQSVVGEHRVDLLACPLQDLEHALDLLLVARSDDLLRGDEELTKGVAELADARVVATRDLPRRAARLFDPARRFLAARLGDLVHPLPVVLA